MMADDSIKKAVQAGIEFYSPIWQRDWEMVMAQVPPDVPPAVEAERERIALLVEQMGMWGYGTLAIAAAIRSGTKASELDDITSPADRRKLTNRPWSAP